MHQRIICISMFVLFMGTTTVLPSQTVNGQAVKGQAILADVLLPGYKNVKHELVFVDSELLQKHKLIAAPIAGFSCVKVIAAGEPFRFSTKYGTRFYLVPNDATDLNDFNKELFAKWPNCEPPQSEIKSLPVTSPVDSALTTLKFASLSGSGVPVIKVVEHVQLDRSGNPAGTKKSMLMFSLICAAGLAFCLFAIRRMKAADKSARREQLAAVESSAGDDNS